MKVIALLLALIACVFAQNQRIIGGSVTDTIRYPYQVAIVQSTGSGYGAFCGGSIISANYVLTAAHCFRSFSNGNNVDKSTSNIYVASTSKISDINNNKRYSITAVNIHPGFTASNSFADQVDICILRVSTIAFDANTKPIVLARSQDTSLYPPGTTSYVSGFGTTNGNNVANRVGSNEMLQVSIPTISTSTCQSVLAQNQIGFNYPIVCAGADGRDACQGDSGGPLAVVVNSNVYLQIGAVVSGTVASTAPVQCGAAGQYGVYIDIASYRSSFIEPITGPLYNLGDSGVATNNGTGSPSSSTFVTYSAGLFATVLIFALF